MVKNLAFILEQSDRPYEALKLLEDIETSDGTKTNQKVAKFKLIKTLEGWKDAENKIHSIWDSGEILLGFGEFLENNKNF